MFFWGVFQCNITFPILKYINSSLISPSAGDPPVIFTHFSSALLSALTLSSKCEEIFLPVLKPAN